VLEHLEDMMENLTFSHIAWDAWRAPRGGAAAIAARQQRRLAELVAFVRQHSRFYADKYRGLPEHVDDVCRLPPVIKSELLEHFDDWVTDPAVTRAGVEAFVADKSRIGHHFLDRYFVCTTSGTTGVPTILVHDTGMLTLSPAIELARAIPNWGFTMRDWWRFVCLEGRVAAVFVTGGHFQGAASMARRHLTNPRRKRTARMFSALAPLPEIVEGLNNYQPAMLAGYPSTLTLLAEEQEAGRLQIQPVLVFPTGEMLLPALKERLKTTFNAHVRESYGASEFPVIAYDCGQGGLHVNADWVILEPVDEAYRPVPVGHTSRKVLVTNLANRVQPLIRYEMGDNVTISSVPCPCGSHLPSIHVEGRDDEILRFIGLEGKLISVMPMALWSVIKDTPGVYRFQAIQTAPERLKVRLQTKIVGQEVTVWEAVRRRTEAFLTAHGLANVNLERASEPPEPTSSGKFRHVWADSRGV
jgi:phenylacetate-CoA ligase